MISPGPNHVVRRSLTTGRAFESDGDEEDQDITKLIEKVVKEK